MVRLKSTKFILPSLLDLGSLSYLLGKLTKHLIHSDIRNLLLGAVDHVYQAYATLDAAVGCWIAGEGGGKGAAECAFIYSLKQNHRKRKDVSLALSKKF